MFLFYPQDLALPREPGAGDALAGEGADDPHGVVAVGARHAVGRLGCHGQGSIPWRGARQGPDLGVGGRGQDLRQSCPGCRGGILKEILKPANSKLEPHGKGQRERERVTLVAFINYSCARNTRKLKL